MNFEHVNRLEIIDHSPCKTCKGKRLVIIQGNDKPTECPACNGLGIPGRNVVFIGSKQVEISLHDDNRTLKIFIKER